MADRQVIIRLKSGTEGPLQIPVGRLADIIQAAQDALFNLGDFLGGYPYRSRGAPPAEVKTQCELIVRELSMGSLQAVMELGDAQTRLDGGLGEGSIATLNEIMDRLGEEGPGPGALEDVLPDERVRRRLMRSISAMFPRPVESFYVETGSDVRSLRRLTARRRQDLDDYLRIPPRPTDIELRGCVIEVRILDPRHLKVFDLERSTVKCLFPKELEDAVVELLGQPVVLRGMGRTDASGEIVQVDLVHSIEPLESLSIEEVRWDASTLRLRTPLTVQPMLEDGTWVLENKETGIVAAASSLEECLRDFQEEFFFLWEQYSKADDAELTGDARELKRMIRGLVLE